MATLIKGRAPASDDWVMAGTEAAPEVSTPAPHLILPMTEFLQAMTDGASPGSRAVLLKPEDHDLTALRPYVAGLPLIAVYFSSTGDGRGYTQATLLRERYDYKGEMRAVGKIRADQMFFLARCGFDAFELLDDEDVATAIAQLDRFTVAYQQGQGRLTHPRRRYGQ